MKPLPSVLNLILQKRYLAEAITTAPSSSYVKKDEEEEKDLPGTMFPFRTSTLEPELKMPAASEFPSGESKISIKDYIERARKKAATSELSFIEPETPYVDIQQQAARNPRLVAATQRARELESSRQRFSEYGSKKPSKSSPTLYSGFPPIPEEQLSRAAQATKSGVEKAVSAAGKYAKEQMPVAMQTAKSIPTTAAHLGLGIVPFEWGSYLGKQITPGLPTDPIFGENPVSVMAGTAAAAATTPWLVDAPIAVSKGLGLRGLQNLSLTGAEGWAAGKLGTQAGLRAVPYIGALWTAGQAMYELDKLAQPYREKRAKDIERIQSFERAQRRRENREPSFTERMDDYFLELSKYGGGVY